MVPVAADAVVVLVDQAAVVGGGFGGGGGNGRYNLTFSLNFNNLLNHTNFAIPVGNLGSSLFGQSTATSAASGVWWRVIRLTIAASTRRSGSVFSRRGKLTTETPRHRILKSVCLRAICG